MTEDVKQGPSVRQLAATALPAVVIGLLSGLLMAAVNWLAHQLQNGLWDSLPDALNVAGDGKFWIITVLTATGIAVGVTVWLVPGHGGTDPATTDLVSKPLKLMALPLSLIHI